MSADGLLRSLFDAAVRAANPEHCLPPYLAKLLATITASSAGRTRVIGAGKAAAAMARAVEDNWPADKPLSGLVITRYGHGLPAERATTRIEVVEAAHPVPDAAGEAATQRLLALLDGLSEDDLVLVLISGGGSALLAAPLPGLSLGDKRSITQCLLRSGASISEINCVRRHLSAVKGGRLTLAAAPARVVTLAISDVPGDDLAAIASGPTVPDPSTCADALAILARHAIDVPPAARHLLEVGAGETASGIREAPLRADAGPRLCKAEGGAVKAPASNQAETPKPGDPCFARSEAHLIATAHASLQAAAEAARAAGITPLVLGDRIEGESQEAAKVLAGIALSCIDHGTPAATPCVLLSGGETTVTVRNVAGRGGRNGEFLLALALALDGHPRIHALAADTDGIDGSEDNAGAMVTPTTLTRLRAAGLDPQQLLDNNDSYRGFAAIGDLVITGPTRTNVNDFRAILIQ